MTEALDRSRFVPTIAVGERRDTPLEHQVTAAGIELVEAPVTVPARPYARLPIRVRRAGRAAPRGHDLWHSFHYLDDYTEPLVARAAGCRRWVFTKKNMSWGGRAWRIRSRLARGIAAQNPTMVDDFFADHRGPVRVVPPGVDAERFAPGPDRPWRTKLGLADDDVLVAHVAHLLPNKNQAHLVEALARTPANVHLVLAGRPLDAAYAAAVTATATAERAGVAGRTHVVGPVDDIPDLLRSADVFAFPSTDEACPVAVLEAMAVGLPVVVSDIPGTRHLVIDGRDGLRFPVGGVAVLAAGLTHLAEDPARRRQLGEAARAKVTADFTVAAESAAYQDLYDEVLAR
jgi:glycosyltransferase involved in cell wall biosynthesis